MEPPLKMDVKDVQRDWIVGFSGEAFSSLVREQAARFAANDAVAERGVLLAESDPIRFSTAFFAGLSLGVPLILANPKWGSAEWAALSGLVNPAMIVGNVPMDTTTREGVHHPLPGQILIPTGGTTGGVKLAIHDWASLLAATRGLHDFLGGDPIHSSCLLPLHHVSGLMQLVRAFSTGGQIRFDEAVTAGYCVSLVPTQLQRRLSDAAAVERLRVARAVFVGGAALPEALAAEARKAHLPIVQVYGMTETAAMIAAVPAEDFLNRDAPGAVPLGEAKIGVDSDGGIRVRTPALFQGYHGTLVCHPPEMPLRIGRTILNTTQNLCLRLRPEALQASHATGLASRFQSRNTLHLQSVVQSLHLLPPQTRNLQHLNQARRN